MASYIDENKVSSARARIKNKLFEKFKPEDFGIIPSSEKVVELQRRVYPVEEVTYGGFEWEIKVAKFHGSLTVSHSARSEFNVWIAQVSKNPDIIVTRFAVTVEFKMLDAKVMELIKALAVENRE